MTSLELGQRLLVLTFPVLPNTPTPLFLLEPLLSAVITPVAPLQPTAAPRDSLRQVLASARATAQASQQICLVQPIHYGILCMFYRGRIPALVAGTGREAFFLANTLK